MHRVDYELQSRITLQRDVAGAIGWDRTRWWQLVTASLTFVLKDWHGCEVLVTGRLPASHGSEPWVGLVFCLPLSFFPAPPFPRACLPVSG